MTYILDQRREFLTRFQNDVTTARKLLHKANHKWASKLLNNLTMEIEKNEWLDLQKKHQLIMIISNSWWLYLNSLTASAEGKTPIDLIRYIDAYKRFFSFLSNLDDFYLFNNFAFDLLKKFIKTDNLSQKGISLFINSFSAKLYEKKEFQKLIEIQILLIFLRKSVVPSEYFHYSMEILGKTVMKIEPSKRSLYIYMILENVCIKYQLMEDSSEFVSLINKILVNRLPQYLRNEFSLVSRISINQRSFGTILVDLEELINYLNDIGEYSWIILIIRNIFSKIQEFQSFGDAVTYIRKFIDFSIKRNRFEIAFEIHDFLEDLFLYQTNLSYDNILIELWVEACKKFVEMKEKKYILQSLEKLNTHLKIPQNNAQIFHYFYTCDLLWQFKSMFFSLEQQDFWKMIFYRTLFEEQNYNLAQKILLYLEKDFINKISDTISLYNEANQIRSQIYSFEDLEVFPNIDQEGFSIKNMILRINSKGVISCRIISTDNQLIEGIITNEYWNDTQIIEIYNDLFYTPEKRKYDFSLTEFGQILYSFLPRSIRNIFKSVKIESLKTIPQIYFVLDTMTIPFDLVYDNNFFLLKYSIGYKIGDLPLGGISFEQETTTNDINSTINNQYKVLIIEGINASNPLKWNEEIKNKELIYPFPTGPNEVNYIVDFFNNQPGIEQLSVLTGLQATQENIINHLSKDFYHIIIFISNIFYSKWSPKDSYILTNDNEIITFNEINHLVTSKGKSLHPLLFFNSQIFDVEGKKLQNVLKTFGEIVAQFDQSNIAGVISRTYPLFNEETNEIISNFFINLLQNNSQGVAILKARQQCIAAKVEKAVEDQFHDLSADDGITRIDLRSSLAVSSYLLFGQPWKKLKP